MGNNSNHIISLAGKVLADGFRRELRNLTGRRLYFFSMVVVPLVMLFFLLGLMRNGLPEHIPMAIVDLDNTTESRAIVRTMSSFPEIKITDKANSFAEAMQFMREGKIYGFFVIPHDFTRDAVSGRNPQVAYYTNSTFFIPGSLLYRSMRTTSVLASAAVVRAYLVTEGATDSQVETMLQPVRLQTNSIHNPWANYSVYLTNSFVPTTLALMIFLVTVFSICSEEKRRTSRQWLASAHESMFMALAGKLLPHTVIFSAVGLLIQAVLFGYMHYPMHCSPWVMILDMLLLVIACQSFAVVVVGLVPNLRFALSICSLIGVLSFSLGAFSYPLEEMYGSIGIFSYIIPVRYYFLIYVDQALNGFPLYFSRHYFIALLVFPLLPYLVLGRLKKTFSDPVYVP